jgi:hypothetical protein
VSALWLRRQVLGVLVVQANNVLQLLNEDSGIFRSHLG